MVDDWTECPFAHPGEKARRRDPRRFHYSGTACPDFREGSCRGEMLASLPTVFFSVGFTLRVIEPSHARMAATVAAECASSLTLRSSCGSCRRQRKRPQRAFVLPAKDRPSEDPMTAHLELLRQRRMMEHTGTKGVSMEHRPPMLGPLWAISQDTLPPLTPIVACHHRYLLRRLPLWVTRTLLPLSLPLSPLQHRPLCRRPRLTAGLPRGCRTTILPCCCTRGYVAGCFASHDF